LLKHSVRHSRPEPRLYYKLNCLASNLFYR